MRRLLLLLLLLAPVCLADEPPKYELGKVTDGLVCLTDATQSYAYYLPKGYTAAKRWPLLFVFDPRQRGKFGAELFQEPAEKYGWIIVSSNNTISDTTWEPNLRAANALWPDAQRRFSVDPQRIYTTGMSGTAMLAWSMAQLPKTKIAGVISCSGRLGDAEEANHVTYDWFGTAGTTDFNYGETALIDERLAIAGANHRMAIFEGGHRWPPPEMAAQAIEWMELQAMRRGLRPRDEALIETLFQKDMAAARAARDLASLRMTESIVRTYAGLRPLDELRASVTAMRERPEMKKAADDERVALSFEQSQRGRMPKAINDFLHAEGVESAPVFAQALEIPRLQKLSVDRTAMGAAAKRVLETIYAQVSFRIPNELMQQKSYARAIAAFEVAYEIHPERPATLYDLACAEALAGRKSAALSRLEEAVRHGFHEPAHAETDPDLESLHDDPRFKAAIQAMKDAGL